MTLHVHAPATMNDSDKKIGIERPSTAAADSRSSDQVPDWLGKQLRQLYTDVMNEPVPDDLKALLKQLEDKERG